MLFMFALRLGQLATMPGSAAPVKRMRCSGGGEDGGGGDVVCVCACVCR